MISSLELWRWPCQALTTESRPGGWSGSATAACRSRRHRRADRAARGGTPVALPGPKGIATEPRWMDPPGEDQARPALPPRRLAGPASPADPRSSGQTRAPARDPHVPGQAPATRRHARPRFRRPGLRVRPTPRLLPRGPGRSARPRHPLRDGLPAGRPPAGRTGRRPRRPHRHRRPHRRAGALVPPRPVASGRSGPAAPGPVRLRHCRTVRDRRTDRALRRQLHLPTPPAGLTQPASVRLPEPAAPSAEPTSA
ncbi:hypothetical protein NG2371_01321 [Nocardia gamkensis]|nr:hypothetical protein [Nocardia gamkensis]